MISDLTRRPYLVKRFPRGSFMIVPLKTVDWKPQTALRSALNAERANDNGFGGEAA